MDVTIPSYSKTVRRQRLFWTEICPPEDYAHRETIQASEDRIRLRWVMVKPHSAARPDATEHGA